MQTLALFQRIVLLATFPLLFISGTPIFAQSATTGAVDSEKKAVVLKQPELQPLIFIKLASIKTLQAKINENFGENSDAGRKLAQNLGMIGMFLGDPALATMEPEADINIIVLNALSRPMPYVAIIKLSNDSPIRDSMKQFGLKVTEVGPYTYLGKNPEILRQAALSKAVFAIAQKKRAADIEIGLWPDRLAGQIQENKILFAQAAARDNDLLGTPEAQANIIGFFDVVCKEMASADSAMMGFSLSDGSLKVQNLIKAKSDTPLFSLLSQNVGGPVPGAQYLTQKGMLSAVSKVDPAATETYYQSLFQSFADATTGNFKNCFVKLMDANHQLWKLTDGGYAVTVELKDDIPALTQVTTINQDRDAYMASLEQFYNVQVNGVYDAVGNLIGQSIKSNVSIEKAAYKVQGVPVDIVGITTTTDTSAAKRAEIEAQLKAAKESGNDAEYESASTLKTELDKAGPQASKMSQTMHYAILDNLLLGSPDRETLQPIIRLVKESKNAAQNLADGMPLDPGVALRFTVQLEDVLLASAKAMESQNPEQAEHLRTAMNNLHVAPITGSMAVGNGKLSSKLEIPLDSIIQIIEKTKPAAPTPAAN